MIKKAILTQRVRELDSGKKKKLWALVSKTRKDKSGKKRVLRWFGESKPSPKSVADAERDIHGNANSADDVTSKFNIDKGSFPANLDLNIRTRASKERLRRKNEISSFYTNVSQKAAKEKTNSSRSERAIKTASRVKKLKIDLPRGFKDWLVRRLGSQLDWADNKYAGAMAYLRRLPQEKQEELKNIFLGLDGTKAEVQTDSETITLDIGGHDSAPPRRRRRKHLEYEDLKKDPRPIQISLFD